MRDFEETQVAGKNMDVSVLDKVEFSTVDFAGVCKEVQLDWIRQRQMRLSFLGNAALIFERTLVVDKGGYQLDQE